MKSIKQQYLDLKEGRMSQHNFMRSVRMSMPQYITNVTSFNDTVKILKNKGILNENNRFTNPDEPDFAMAVADQLDYSELTDEQLKTAKAYLDDNAYDLQGDFANTYSVDGGSVAAAKSIVNKIKSTLSENIDELYTASDPIEFALKSYLANGYSYTEAIRAVAAEEEIDEETLASQYPQDRVDTEGYEDEDENADIEDLLKQYGEEEAGKYTTGGEQFKISERMDASNITWDWEDADVDYDTDEEGNEGAFGTVYGRDAEGNMYKGDWGSSDPDAALEDVAYITDFEKVHDASELNEAKKKKEKKELHPNQIHPQELRMGIKVELEHTDNLDKAKKIALDHLAENPFYYTALKLAGIESPSAPKAKAPKAVKKEKAAEAELTDKENAMKPVKGFEKAKASSNKARKETNSGVKGVSELTHNAKTVRGLQKFAATGGKMKTVKEGQLNEARGEWTITGTLTKDELDKLKDIIGKYEIDVQETDDTYETTISHEMYNDKALEQAVNQARGKISKVQSPEKYRVFQSKLESLVREVMDEMFDGRDDMNAKNEY
jgi:hypothetical protein